MVVWHTEQTADPTDSDSAEYADSYNISSDYTDDSDSINSDSSNSDFAFIDDLTTLTDSTCFIPTTTLVKQILTTSTLTPLTILMLTALTPPTPITLT